MKFGTGFKLMGKGLENLWRHKGSTLAAFVSITIAITVLGYFALTWLNIMNLTDNFLGNLDVRVFLVKPGAVKKIETLDGVAKFEYITPDMALTKMAENYQFSSDYLKNVLADNPLQASYSLRVKDVQNIHNIVSTLEAMPEVDEVIYGGKTADSLIKLQRIIGGFGLLLLFILIMAILLVVANTLRLSFAVRKQEIALEKILGAGPLYIVAPFLWEGTALGLLSASAAVLVVLYSYKMFSAWSLTSLPYLPLKSLASIKQIFIGVGLALGILMGFIGSVWGVRRYWPKD